MTFQNLARIGMYGQSPDRISCNNETTNVRCSVRLLRPVLQKTGVLGVRLVGGNAVGIFIHSIEPCSPASDVGIKRGTRWGSGNS